MKRVEFYCLLFCLLSDNKNHFINSANSSLPISLPNLTISPNVEYFNLFLI